MSTLSRWAAMAGLAVGAALLGAHGAPDAPGRPSAQARQPAHYPQSVPIRVIPPAERIAASGAEVQFEVELQGDETTALSVQFNDESGALQSTNVVPKISEDGSSASFTLVVKRDFDRPAHVYFRVQNSQGNGTAFGCLKVAPPRTTGAQTLDAVREYAKGLTTSRPDDPVAAEPAAPVPVSLTPLVGAPDAERKVKFAVLLDRVPPDDAKLLVFYSTTKWIKDAPAVLKVGKGEKEATLELQIEPGTPAGTKIAVRLVSVDNSGTAFGTIRVP